MNKEIKATVYKTDGTKKPIILTGEETLESLQKIVGGYIEVIYIITLEDLRANNYDNVKDLIINEEGLLKDLPLNPWSELITKGSIWENQQFRGDMILTEGRLP